MYYIYRKGVDISNLNKVIMRLHEAGILGKLLNPDVERYEIFYQNIRIKIQCHQLKKSNNSVKHKG